MLWEVEIEGKTHDPERVRVLAECTLLTHGGAEVELAKTGRGFLLQGDLDAEAEQRLTEELLVDPIVEMTHLAEITGAASRDRKRPEDDTHLTVVLKPGVMDPVAQSIMDAT